MPESFTVMMELHLMYLSQRKDGLEETLRKNKKIFRKKNSGKKVKVR